MKLSAHFIIQKEVVLSMEIAAFFDMDGTIIMGNSGLRFIKFLYKRGAQSE